MVVQSLMVILPTTYSLLVRVSVASDVHCDVLADHASKHARIVFNRDVCHERGRKTVNQIVML